MAENATGFDEESLDESIIVKNLLNRKDLTSFYFVWPIRNYTKLKKNVFYTKSAVDIYHKSTFILVKARGTLFVFLYTDAVHKQVLFCLTNRKGAMVYGGKTVEIIDGLYISEFCRKAVQDSRFLCDDELKVQCRYDIDLVDHRLMVLPYGEFRDSADVIQLCIDFQRLHITAGLTDFIIYFHGQQFPVHKLVLAARSSYFCDMFTKDDSMTSAECHIASDPSSMYDVLLYLYSGEMKILDVDLTIGVFLIAHLFQVSCLINKCVNSLTDNLTHDNAEAIMELATSFGLVKLKNEARHYL